MKLDPIGIGDLALHLPETSIAMETIIAERVKQDPIWERHLTRAVKSTGQKSMRFPRPWEDPITLAAEAAVTLLGQNPDHPLKGVRFLAMGTETSVDMSKPGSAYVLSLLSQAGKALPSTLSTFQIQHACAGGALAMLNVAGFLQAAGRQDESAIVLTSDIARYEAPSTAEVTQGAGSAAILVQKNPALIELDLANAGFFSRDVDDFFRPLGSVTAKVKGGFSVQCYNEALIAAFEDHCARAEVAPAAELQSIDVFCLHIPYAMMPLMAMQKLLHKHLGLETAAADEFLRQRGFFAGLEPTSEVGNIYTGSLFLGMAFSLKERLETLGDQLVGKKIMMASYGSGNTMSVITGRLADRAPAVIRRWDLGAFEKNKINATFSEYERWLLQVKTPQDYPAHLESCPPQEGHFYLAAIREDGYREYGRR